VGAELADVSAVAVSIRACGEYSSVPISGGRLTRGQLRWNHTLARRRVTRQYRQPASQDELPAKRLWDSLCGNVSLPDDDRLSIVYRSDA
jgi:hypothetical protein